MAISYRAIAQECITFFINENAAEGMPCKLTENDTVAVCSADDAFIGVIQSARDGLACVAMRGFVTLPYSGTAPEVGYVSLCAGTDNTVTVSEDAQSYLVVNVNKSAQTVTFLL